MVNITIKEKQKQNKTVPAYNQGSWSIYMTYVIQEGDTHVQKYCI